MGLRKHYSNKTTSGGDGIPAELFQILKDDAVKVLHSICQQIWKTQQWPQDWKISVFTPILKKGNAKECSNYCTVALILQASKAMLKILQAKLQQYMNQKFPNDRLDLEKAEVPKIKGRGTKDQIASFLCIMEKAREFQKNIYSASLTTLKTLYGSQQTGNLNNRMSQNWARSTSRLYIVTLLI